jgi:hypothetical protein
MIVALLALFVALSGVGMAANGGNFILGHSNSASLNTSLSAPVAGGRALQVTNNNTSNAASTALGLTVATGHAPFTVNSGVKVTNLNADTLDGLDSSAFAAAVLHWTNLTLKNGWIGNCFGGGTPQVAKSSEGIVYFRGTICTPGTNSNAFALPAGFIPSESQWLTADECNAYTGRLSIPKTGEVSVEGDPNTTFAGSAACFTSLAGVEFALP